MYFVCRRRGFTLVELLAVIAIIAILVGLILPAIQAAREAARRASCGNNVKQMSLAALSFHNAARHFPSAGWGYSWAPHPDRGFAERQTGGWTYSLLPYLEQNELYSLGSGVGDSTDTDPRLNQANKKRLETPLPVLNCPSRRESAVYPVDHTIASYVSQPVLCDRLRISARTDYAINGGETYHTIGRGPADLSAGDTGQYTFPSLDNSTGICFTRSRFSITTIADGASKTYMIGEKYLGKEFYRTGASIGDDQGPYCSDEYDSIRWAAVGPLASDYRAPMQDRINQDERWGSSEIHRFGSAHSGSFNMAFCDGSIQPVGYAIDEVVHRRLCNRKDELPVNRSGL